jgi:hypothetical protein
VLVMLVLLLFIKEEISALYPFTFTQIATNQPCSRPTLQRTNPLQLTYLAATENISRDQPVVTSTCTGAGNNVFIPEAGWNILAFQAHVCRDAGIVVCKTHSPCVKMNGDRGGGTSVDVPISTPRSNNLLARRY